MFSPSPSPVPESTTRPNPPPPIHHKTFHLTTRLTIASGLMLVAVICGLMILFMFIFHYYYHQRLRVIDDDTHVESRQLSGAAAEEIPATAEMGFREIKTGEIGNWDGKRCAICIEGFGEEEICGVIENCGHIFHKDCINRWLRIEKRCPLCRCSVHSFLSPSRSRC